MDLIQSKFSKVLIVGFLLFVGLASVVGIISEQKEKINLMTVFLVYMLGICPLR